MPAIITRKTLYLLLSATLLAPTVFGQKPQQNEAYKLLPAQSLKREIKREEIHRYKFNLQENDFFQVHVQQMGINVRLNLLNANGNTLATMSVSGGSETLSFVARESGRFTLEIAPRITHVDKGSYTLKREGARAATAKDKRRVEVERLFEEGMAAQRIAGQIDTAVKKLSEAQAGWKELGDTYMEELTRQEIEQSKATDEFIRARALLQLGTPISIMSALTKFREAGRLYQEKGNKLAAAASLLGAATIYYALGNTNSALEVYKQVLSFSREIADKYLEATVLNSIGLIYSTLGNKSAALEYFNQALLIYKGFKNELRVAYTLRYIGSAYQLSGEGQKALDIFNRLLPVFKTFDDKVEESLVRHDASVIYFSSGEYQKALFYYKEALRLRRESGAKCEEASTLTNMGEVYNVLGEKSKALDFLINQALPLYKTVGDCYAQRTTLNNIGKIYYELGENQKVLEYCHRALPMFKAARDKSGEAAALNNLGGAYRASGKYKEALDSYNMSRNVYRSLGDRKHEATALTNIGVVYSASGDDKQALLILDQALRLSREARDKKNEAMTLSNMGEIYFSSGDNAKALEFIYQALPLFRSVGDRSGEAIVLGNAMSVWKSLGNRRLAIFYGKQSINKLQQLRGATRGIDNETQKSFLHSVQHAYQNLAELLIAESQLEQAIQVLSLYQDQQFFDFNRGANSSFRQAILSPREDRFAKRYEARFKKVEQTGSQIEEFNRWIGNSQADEQLLARLRELEAELKTASDSFLTILKDAEKEFVEPTGSKDRVSTLQEVADMRKVLAKLGTATGQNVVTLYTLVGNNNFHVLMVKRDGRVKSFESPVKAADLNEKILEFYALLQSPTYNPQLLGKELYDIIFKPLEAELKETNAQTLMWQLDGPLRYIPVAALWDGEKYLVERYQNVAFTRADNKEMLQSVSKQWEGTGFGNSQEYKVDFFNDGKNLIPFSALSGVTKELTAIFKTEPTGKTGILTGEVFSDKTFTRKKFFEAMQARRPLVHIASHFRFYPGDSSLSFLLLGDGTALTLDEMKSQKDLFRGVQLLTLSACNTAATIANAEGREIDGFTELAQRLGASAVLATLWQVSDASTPWLMTEFYRTIKSAAGPTKSEALRTAQMALLNGTADTNFFSDVGRGVGTSNVKVVVLPDASKQPHDLARSEVVFVSKKNAPLFEHDDKKPFAHPYYWSPFVLFGNWR